MMKMPLKTSEVRSYQLLLFNKNKTFYEKAVL